MVEENWVCNGLCGWQFGRWWFGLVCATQCCLFLAENWVELREKKKIAFIWSREINIVANVKSEVFWLKHYRG